MAVDHYRALAEKFMMKGLFEAESVPDSLLEFVRFAFSEEEAEIVSALGPLPRTAGVVARKVRRPAAEVAPLLEGLSKRFLIGSLGERYIFLPLLPGIMESVMTGGEDTPYHREFARLFDQVYAELLGRISASLGDKKVGLMRIIPVDRSIEAARVGVLALPTDRYREMVERSNSFCQMNVCACRHEKRLLDKGCDKPLDVCCNMGWVADYAVGKGLARRISKEEFIEIKERAAEAGLVNLVDNLENPVQACSCCGCCCAGLRMITEFNFPGFIAESHFVARVETDKCIGCRACWKICPMGAVTMEGKGKQRKARIEAIRCIGCGVCVIHCKKARAMTLAERPRHRPPARTVGEYALNRYFEMKGWQGGYLPKLSLGIGEALSRLAPFHHSGPKYKPPK